MSRKSLTSIVLVFVILTATAVWIITGNGRYSDAENIKADQQNISSTSDFKASGDKPGSSVQDLSESDVQKLIEPRTMGKKDAPVRLIEFASLSCPHCAHFYKETFPKFKAEYIDTGKVLYTYIDFPLNAPALTAAAIAICVPEDNYFKYIDYLFQTQEQWAFSSNQETILIQNAKLLGGDGDKLKTCADSMNLKGALVKRMKDETEKFGIGSTPTFIINDDKNQAFTGAVAFDEFKKKMDDALAAKSKAGK